MIEHHYSSDWSDIDDYLDKLSREPDGSMKASLDGALFDNYLIAQRDVHRRTGYLSSTIHTDSHSAGSVWSGTLSADADYAGYEQARGGEHDFFRNVEDIGDDVVRAIVEAL